MDDRSKFDLHICLASAQPLPNLIPALLEETKPKKVILLVSSDMEARAAILEANFRKLGCPVEQIPISPYRIEDIRATVLDLLASRERESLALNATGGTKIMALGAAEVFRELGRPVFYVDTDNRQFITLFPSSSSTPLADLVRVKTCLSAFGYSIVEKGSLLASPDRQELCEWLIDGATRYAKAVFILNGCVSEAEKKKSLLADLKDQQLDFSELLELLERFQESGVLTREGCHITFVDENARRFAGGGWLEEYVGRIASRLKGKQLIHDFGCNLVVETRERVRNEIDLAFTARNRLHLIECKSGRLGEKEGKESRADGVAYKLDNLRDLMGGTYGKAMLVSFQKLTGDDRKRCAVNKISVVEGNALAGLEKILRDWI
ncbi:MAG: DUF1887 family protein [Deltaproteobacteria bacterium]|nr:DUF1887 family protein [Deltaproteobacteria bacterium]